MGINEEGDLVIGVINQKLIFEVQFFTKSMTRRFVMAITSTYIQRMVYLTSEASFVESTVLFSELLL